MRGFPPNNSSCATAVTRSGLPSLLREPQIELTVDEINRLRLVIKLVILGDQTRRLLRLVIRLVILAERMPRLGGRFEDLTAPVHRDLRIGIDRATARLALRGGLRRPQTAPSTSKYFND